MEKRNFKRITFGLKAEITLNGKNFGGVIEDLSEAGANIITGPIEDASGFVLDADMELKFRPLDEEIIVLNCKIQWINKAYPNTQMYKIGLVLVNPPWDESTCFV